MAVNQQHGEVWRQLEVSKWTWKHGPWAWDPPENMRNISSVKRMFCIKMYFGRQKHAGAASQQKKKILPEKRKSIPG